MKQPAYSQFAVLGLGRFGLSIVKTLSEYDVNILACDKDAARLHEATGYATHLAQADVADETALHKLGLGNFDAVVVAMGEDFESSVIATMIAKESGAGFVLVKARGLRQKKILESIGADQVVLPELEMGAKVARKLASPNLLDLLEDSEHYTIAEIHPLETWVGKTIRQADIRRQTGQMILAIRTGDKILVPVPAQRVLQRNDVLITLSERDPTRPE